MNEKGSNFTNNIAIKGPHCATLLVTVAHQWGFFVESDRAIMKCAPFTAGAHVRRCNICIKHNAEIIDRLIQLIRMMLHLLSSKCRQNVHVKLYKNNNHSNYFINFIIS